MSYSGGAGMSQTEDSVTNSGFWLQSRQERKETQKTASQDKAFAYVNLRKRDSRQNCFLNTHTPNKTNLRITLQRQLWLLKPMDRRGMLISYCWDCAEANQIYTLPNKRPSVNVNWFLMYPFIKHLLSTCSKKHWANSHIWSDNSVLWTVVTNLSDAENLSWSVVINLLGVIYLPFRNSSENCIQAPSKEERSYTDKV